MLDELRRLNEAATPGPWSTFGVGDEYETTPYLKCGEGGFTTSWDEEKLDDLELIVAMRNALPKILACIEAQDALNDCVCNGCIYGDPCENHLDIKYNRARNALDEGELRS